MASAPSIGSLAEAARPVTAVVERQWAVACVLAASTSVALGVHWDIAWHRSIGRDTFWSPPHLLMYFAAVVAGLASAALVARATFRHDRAERAAAVRVLGLHGPLGAFVCGWGAAAMLTSAPFDDWWHNAYGLDVKILSPPHVLLAIGIIAIHIGALLFVLAERNVATAARRQRLDGVFLYVFGMILIAVTTLIMEPTARAWMHDVPFYRVVALAIPGLLTAAGSASERRWASTIVVGIYSATLCLMIWIFPLFPAEPKLGPVLYAVTAFVPPEFPLLLIVPAFVLDLARPRLNRPGTRRPARAAIAGLLFTATYVPAQWLFANFLMSPLARNRLFGTCYFDFRTPADGLYRRYLFAPASTEGAGQIVVGFAVVTLAAGLMAWVGLAWGDWMRRVRR